MTTPVMQDDLLQSLSHVLVHADAGLYAERVGLVRIELSAGGAAHIVAGAAQAISAITVAVEKTSARFIKLFTKRVGRHYSASHRRSDF